MSVGPLKAITVAAGPTGYTECGHAWPNAEVIKYIFPSVLELRRGTSRNPWTGFLTSSLINLSSPAISPATPLSYVL